MPEDMEQSINEIALSVVNRVMKMLESRKVKVQLDEGAFMPERAHDTDARSEERRVGKECRSRWSPYH